MFSVYPALQAQEYFGKHRPQYESFDFNVKGTTHFDIYHYFENDSIIDRIALQTEKWYRYHQHIFADTFKYSNPIIFYPDHIDFQQTRATFSNIGAGTGGFTDAYKNRIVMPLTFTWQQTDHVIGHEMVHVFQFRTMLRNDSLNLNNIQNVPLWMVEGLAEYLSIGSTDPNTAMWMRDAVLSNDFPTLQQMSTNFRYFPYRFGHAFWVYVTKIWGDSIIQPLFTETAKYGYNHALKKVLGYEAKDLSAMWKAATFDYYYKHMPDSNDTSYGVKLIDNSNGGNVNISPSISPNGKYLVFISERDGLNVELYLAEASTGKVIKRLNSRIKSGDFDAINFVENTGTWSPDSKQYAFIAINKGRNIVFIVDSENGKVLREIIPEGNPTLSYPAWHPAENKIVLSVLKEGHTNLAFLNLENEELSLFTNDSFDQIQASWSSDGKNLVYSSNESSLGMPMHKGLSLVIHNIENNSKQITPVFQGALNTNPLFASNDSIVLFLSDADGFRNMYSYNRYTSELAKRTQLLRGITGYTPFSPSLSYSPASSEVVYSYFAERKYTVYKAKLSELDYVVVSNDFRDLSNAILPPTKYVKSKTVDNKLSEKNIQLHDSLTEFENKPYMPRFTLDDIGNTGAGVYSRNYYSGGFGVSGGIYAIFSDITGNNTLVTSVNINGQPRNFGGLFGYYNQKNRFKWGAMVSHIPYFLPSRSFDTIPGNEVSPEYDTSTLNVSYDNLLTLYESSVNLSGYYPLNSTQRIEGAVSTTLYNHRFDRYAFYYDGNELVESENQKKLDLLNTENYAISNIDIALVGDNSLRGVASPLKGMRYRIQGSYYFGSVNFFSSIVDARKYFRMKPFTLAVRGVHRARFGVNGRTNLLSPVFLGRDWFVRGYSYNSFNKVRFPDLSVNELYGNNIFLANLELRLPFTGFEQISLIKSSFLFTELALFADAGYVTDKSQNSLYYFNEIESEEESTFISSVGVSLRLNFFGQLIVEQYFAVPLQMTDNLRGVFGLNILPGW
jgi:Tol biopolymer transport system component